MNDITRAKIRQAQVQSQFFLLLDSHKFEYNKKWTIISVIPPKVELMSGWSTTGTVEGVISLKDNAVWFTGEYNTRGLGINTSCMLRFIEFTLDGEKRRIHFGRKEDNDEVS